MTTTWNIDASHSTIGFSIRHMIFSKVRGRFLKHTGAIQLADDATQSWVELAVDAASIDTGTAQRDTHLRSADFFDAEKFPELSFDSTNVEKLGDKYRVKGDLTIRGVQKPVTLEAEYLGGGKDPWGNQRIGFSANLSINRKDFGLNWNQLLEAGGVLVGETIEIALDVQAVKA